MSLPRLAVCGLLALMAGALAAWWASAPADLEELRITEPPFLKQAVVRRSLDGEKLDFLAPVSGVAVVVFYSRECPIPAESMTTLSRLATDFPANRLFLAGVCVDPDADRATIETYNQEHKITSPDDRSRPGRQPGPPVRSEVGSGSFRARREGRLRYRGRINGQIPAPGQRSLVRPVRACAVRSRPFSPIGRCRSPTSSRWDVLRLSFPSHRRT